MNLDVRALAEIQLVVAFGAGKAFRVCLGDDDFVVMIQKEGISASHTRPAEKAGEPSLNECAEVIGEMFRRMLCGSGNSVVSDRSDRTDLTDPTDGTYSIFPEMPVEVDEEDGEDLLWAPLEENPNTNIPAESTPQFFDRLIADKYGARIPDVSEREEGPGEVDAEAGWEAYRREILETMGPTSLPAWADAPAQLRECFSAGIWAALEPVAAKGVVQSLREDKERLERVVARHWDVISKEPKGGAQ